MADEAVIMGVLRGAISDPRTVVPRRGGGGLPLDPLYEWQARAVLAALEAAGMSVVASAEVERLRKLVTLLQNSGDQIGYAVVTYNQASHQPEFDYSDLHSHLEDAVNERDHKRQETMRIGRHETHVIAEVTELKENEDD